MYYIVFIYIYIYINQLDMICGSENVAISQQMRIFDWEHENSPPVVVFDPLRRRTGLWETLPSMCMSDFSGGAMTHAEMMMATLWQ